MAKRKRKRKSNKIKSKNKNKDKKYVSSGVSDTVSSESENISVKDIPVYDYIEEHNIDTGWGIEQCIDSLIDDFERGYFFVWEAVVREEKGFPLSEKQKAALDDLWDFTDDDDSPILYINEMPRPKDPWYEIVKEVVPKLILEPFKTYEVYSEMHHNGWPAIAECLEEHTSDLSLPPDVSSPVDIIQPEIRHKLWLQCCFDELSGIGQEKELTLEDEEQRLWRVESFISALKEYKESIEYFDLTPETLVKKVKLPPKDEKILLESLLHELGMKSVSDKFIEVL